MSRRVPFLLGAALVCSPTCDTTAPRPPAPTLALLYAQASFTDATTGRTSSCYLTGNWDLPTWPSASRTDTATFELTRLVADSTSKPLNEALIASLAFTWAPVDSLHFTLTLSAPLAITLAGVRDSARGSTAHGSWPCPSTLPLARDSTLLTAGYEPDSLSSGSFTVTRVVPSD